ncbi:MAG: hypothetical protein ACO21C_02985 [Burkholderiaceae bacterium]
MSATQRLFGFVWQGQAMAIDFAAVHAAFRSSQLLAGPPKSAALGMLMREGTPTMVLPHDQLLETLDGASVAPAQTEPPLDAAMWVVVLSEQTTPVRLAFRAEETHGPFRASLVRGEHGVIAEYSDRQWQVLRAKPGVA